MQTLEGQRASRPALGSGSGWHFFFFFFAVVVVVVVAISWAAPVAYAGSQARG